MGLVLHSHFLVHVYMCMQECKDLPFSIGIHVAYMMVQITHDLN